MQAIDHVIVLTPENRSFHYILGFLEDHRDHYNYDLQGNRIVCSPVDPMTGGDSITHDIAETVASVQGINGEPMTGFIAANQRGIYNQDAYEASIYRAEPSQIMGYVKDGSLPILHTLAKNFCVCTRWFGSAPTETFPNRAFMIAATSGGRSNNVPKHLWKVISNRATIFDRLSGAGLSWKIYYPNYLDLITNLDLDGLSKLARVYQLATLITDIQTNQLPVYSYVELDTDDDSISELVPYIPSVEAYIGQVYNALRSSAYWTRTLLIISYDEHGGFYDPIIPPPCVPPDEIDVTYHSSDNPAVPKTFKFDQLGPRGPAILISPWIEAGFDATIYDHTSVLAFLEHRFNLPPLTQRDRHANYQFKFRSTLRSDDMPTNLPIPSTATSTPLPPTTINRFLIYVTRFLVKLGHLLHCRT
jgi:phospholipase C